MELQLLPWPVSAYNIVNSENTHSQKFMFTKARAFKSSLSGVARGALGAKICEEFVQIAEQGRQQVMYLLINTNCAVRSNLN